MSKYERNFKGVWIPADVWLNPNLSIQEKIMLVEIDSLNACPKRGCWASNEHFAKFFGLSKSRVSEVINTLVKKGYLKAKFKRSGRQIIERNIFVLTPFEKPNTPLRETEDPPSGNAEENNTNFNNTEVTKHSSSELKKTSSDKRDFKVIPDAAVQTPQGEKWGTDGDLKAARWIYQRALVSMPTLKEPTWATWANSVRLMRSIDGRAHRQICEVFDFASKDSFWCANILSPDALRKQWDKLLAKMIAEPKQQGKPSSGMIDPSDTSWVNDEWGY